jgi:hypothetical protein
MREHCRLITIAVMPGQLPDLEMLTQFICQVVLLDVGYLYFHEINIE